MAEGSQKEIEIITEEKLILTEGRDAELFLRYLLNNKGISGIQIVDFGGVEQLSKALISLKGIEGFDGVTSILIFRDSEKSSQSACQSVNSSLKAAGLITIEIKPFIIASQNNRNIGFGLFPGKDEKGCLYEYGRLEDLCLNIFKDRSNRAIIKTYIDDFQNRGKKFVKPHKNELHTLFSFSDTYVGLKMGETARAGGFDFDSLLLSPFLEMINQM